MRIAWLGLGLIALASSVVSGQMHWGQPAFPRAGACFYQDADFRGQYFCAQRGQNIGTVPGGMNDGISSIRIFGDASVVVFVDGNFRGPSARFDTDVRNLRRQGWNDRISSMRIGTSSWGGGGRPPMWGNPQIPREGACFFKDANFRGQFFCIPRGRSYRMLPSGFNDQISSIRVQRANVMIFRDQDFSGRSTVFTGDVPNVGGAWNDMISSVRVY